MNARPPCFLSDAIAEVKREIGLRRTVYAGRVRTRQMAQSEADYHLSRMEGALYWLQKHQDAVQPPSAQTTLL